ncbi:uncharacterized protein LOC124075307 [Marmota monax]|uniref:uncharacterized protein LOC124075307 n=1 Tax=Marmota monax TaxID=9995 RepID=UPI001EAFB864|nr:uncharacterized protein LOC124075307 [Marmota monax]
MTLTRSHILLGNPAAGPRLWSPRKASCLGWPSWDSQVTAQEVDTELKQVEVDIGDARGGGQVKQGLFKKGVTATPPGREKAAAGVPLPQDVSGFCLCVSWASSVPCPLPASPPSCVCDQAQQMPSGVAHRDPDPGITTETREPCGLPCHLSDAYGGGPCEEAASLPGQGWPKEHWTPASLVLLNHSPAGPSAGGPGVRNLLTRLCTRLPVAGSQWERS